MVIDPGNSPLITTVKERCRVCYTCVRECMAKAIRIADGQAEVIPERCIGCGNCVRICSQHAKQVRNNIADVEQLLASDRKVSACVAPSFPAEFEDIDHERVVGMIRALGFDYVHEVSFGADLVARRYRELLEESDDPSQRYIATSCPAVVGYVERYHPHLVGKLAPIVSPMVAAARVLHQLYGEDLAVVFIGPCIAKKGEAASPNLDNDVDTALTFAELRTMFAERKITPLTVTPGDFDEPHGGPGSLFPISRGMLQAAGIKEDLVDEDVVATDGRENIAQAVREFETGDMRVRLLEMLCCHGCIMGAGMTSTNPLFSRRADVSHYVRRRMQIIDQKAWQANMERFASVNLGRTYTPFDQRAALPSPEEIRRILSKMGKHTVEDELNCGACGYDTCVEHAIAIYKGLAENEMCLPYTIDQLSKTNRELETTNEELASTRASLMQSEKLASMGQLAAGIAHEVNNPLGVVLMYAHLLQQDHSENPDLSEDLKMIVEQADRCKTIVSGLLNFARKNKVVLQPANVGHLIEHTIKAMKIADNVQITTEHSDDDLTAEIDRDQIVQVLTNLISNAQAAMSTTGGTITVRTHSTATNVIFEVADNGTGISEENLAKIFEPFFTTKQMGMGTGLGLAVTYGIVKMHRGDIQVQSNADPEAGPTGTIFTVSLPREADKDM